MRFITFIYIFIAFYYILHYLFGYFSGWTGRGPGTHERRPIQPDPHAERQGTQAELGEGSDRLPRTGFFRQHPEETRRNLKQRRSSHSATFYIQPFQSKGTAKRGPKGSSIRAC